MSKQTKKNFAQVPSFRDILHRISVPFLLFSVVLFVSLSASAEFLLPKLTSIDVAGMEHDTAKLKSYVREVEEKVERLEMARSEYVAPLRQGLYGVVKAAKYDVKPLLQLKADIADGAGRVVADGGGSVRFMVPVQVQSTIFGR